jgi:putative transposase
VHWFETLDQAREIIEAWRRDYNESRPHMALAEVAPSDFARRIGTLTDPPSVKNAGN